LRARRRAIRFRVLDEIALRQRHRCLDVSLCLLRFGHLLLCREAVWSRIPTATSLASDV
jgi:hypothetical protein